MTHLNMKTAALMIAILCGCASGAMAQGGLTGAMVPETYPLGGRNAGQYKGKFTVFYFWSSTQPASVKAFSEVVRLFKAYGQNEKFGGFVLFNLDEPLAATAARQLSKGLPFEQIFDGPNGQHNQNFKAPPDKLPVATILSPDLALVWSDQFAKLEDTLVKLLAVEKAAAPVDADNPEQAIASLAAGLTTINDRGEFTEAIERLAALKPALLEDPKVFAAAAQVVLRIKTEKENKSGIERALKANPKAKAAIAQISRRAATVFNAPLGGDTDRATAPGGTAGGPTTPPTRDELADRKLEAAEALQLEGKDVAAYEQFKDIAQRYTGTEASKAAAQHVTDYEADGTFMKTYNASAGEEKAAGMLKLARSYKEAGRKDLAKKLIDELLATYPDSGAAREAKDEGLNK